MTPWNWTPKQRVLAQMAGFLAIVAVQMFSLIGMVWKAITNYGLSSAGSWFVIIVAAAFTAILVSMTILLWRGMSYVEMRKEEERDKAR